LGFPKLDPELPKFERIDPLVLEMLRRYSFQTVAHNGGDYAPFYKEYARTGCDFIEIDVFRHRGKVYVGHEKYFGGIGIDTFHKSVSLSAPNRMFSSVVNEIKKDGYRIFIDFKDTDSPDQVLNILEDHKMLSDSAFSSEAWRVLEKVKERQGGNASNLFYTIQNEKNIDNFFTYDGLPKGPFGISLDAKIASKENISRFHEAGGTVFVYVIKTVKQAVTVLANGADGIISNNLTLLSFQPKTA